MKFNEFENIAKEMGISGKMVESAFVSCLEEAVSHYLDTPEVEVNLEREKVTAFLKCNLQQTIHS